ncbi:DUF1513 domain-containing protein [Hyphomicrobiales bacterium 4NK60-0047b]
MAINRRDFIRSGLAVSAGTLPAFILPPATQASEETEELYAAARRHSSNEERASYSAVLFTRRGDLRSVTLPGRGHDIAVRPQRLGDPITLPVEIVAFARRPGRFAIAFSSNIKKPPLQFFAREDRHFYGHGVFSPNGKILFTTENDFENGVGVVGIRDATDNYKQIGEFSSHGIGPHDMALLDDGITLVIANGGLETSPETGRQVLNLTEMEPSLVYIDRRTGTLIEKQTLPPMLHQLSIRHLTVASNNRVVFGAQFKGPKTDLHPLVGFHDRGHEIKLVEAPKEILHDMKNYVGSVTVDRSGDIIAASHPRGGFISYWDAVNRTFIGTRKLIDGCGVARTHSKGEFVQTSGTGHVEQTSLSTDFSKRFDTAQNVQWDNHAILVK